MSSPGRVGDSIGAIAATAVSKGEGKTSTRRRGSPLPWQQKPSSKLGKATDRFFLPVWCYVKKEEDSRPSLIKSANVDKRRGAGGEE